MRSTSACESREREPISRKMDSSKSARNPAYSSESGGTFSTPISGDDLGIGKDRDRGAWSEGPHSVWWTERTQVEENSTGTNIRSITEGLRALLWGKWVWRERYSPPNEQSPD